MPTPSSVHACVHVLLCEHNLFNNYVLVSCPYQLLVGEDGFVGSLLEHSAADGPAAILIDVFMLDLL